MAHFWIQDGSASNSVPPATEEWLVALLGGDAFAFKSGYPELRQSAGCGESPAVFRHQGETGEAWVLIGSQGARVNGSPLLLGVAVLRDRDEIQLGARRSFFSTERLARVEPFPGAAQRVYCPRCSTVIEPGTDAVQCPAPRCGVWHHQTNELPCWTYSPTCGLCEQSTDLDAGYRWTPEEL